MHNKIANHRNSFKSYAAEKVKDASGAELTFGTLTDEGPLQLHISGAQIQSFLPAYAHMKTTVPNATLNTYIDSNDKWYQVTGSATSLDESYLFTNTTNMKLRYDGETYTYNHKRFVVNASFSVSSSHPTLLSLALATGSTSGDIQSSSITTFESVGYGSLSSTDTKRWVSLTSIVQLTASQILSLWASATGSNVSFYVHSSSYNIMQL